MSRVLVIGGGLAGLRAAIAAAEAGAAVRLVAKAHPTASTSTLATGGIAAALGADDSWEQHAEDTLRAGAGIADVDAVEVVCRGASEAVRAVDGWGVPFDRDAAGGLGAHVIGGNRRARMIAAGDHSGRAIVEVLWRRALGLSVAMATDRFLLRLVVSGGACRGAVVLDLRTGEVEGIAAESVVLATGGLGRLYATTTNPALSTGDGTAAALRAGASLLDMEMTQFYPTCFPGSGVCVTEEARARGAWLIDDRGDRVMARHAPDAMDMAGRDVLSRALHAELAAGRRVYLDCRRVIAGDPDGPLRDLRRLALELAGVDLEREPLPVVPGFHYQMGGVATDVDGRTDVPGLFAVGECACVSVHGANRIGANSLLETLVMGEASGAAAASAAIHGGEDASPALARAEAEERSHVASLLERAGDGRETADVTARLRAEMSAHAGIIRDHAGLGRAAAELEALGEEAARCAPGDRARVFNVALRRWLELQNLVVLGRAVIAGALAREESRGAHFRADAPQASPRAHHLRLRLDGTALRLSTSPVRLASSGAREPASCA